MLWEDLTDAERLIILNSLPDNLAPRKLPGSRKTWSRHPFTQLPTRVQKAINSILILT